MTSSLVGSEMCIRDSSFPDCPRLTSRGNAREVFGNYKYWKSMEIIEPVSYTHLTLPTICSV
eukprot:7946749-Prorocentrum_lima.AAC.1